MSKYKRKILYLFVSPFYGRDESRGGGYVLDLQRCPKKKRKYSCYIRRASLPVNFTNILHFYQLFRMQVFCAACMCLQFRFVICWQRKIGIKAACKILVKLQWPTQFHQPFGAKHRCNSTHCLEQFHQQNCAYFD